MGVAIFYAFVNRWSQIKCQQYSVKTSRCTFSMLHLAAINANRYHLYGTVKYKQNMSSAGAPCVALNHIHTQQSNTCSLTNCSFLEVEGV